MSIFRNNSKKLLITSAVVILGVLCFIVFVDKPKANTYPIASSYGDILIGVNIDGHTEEIRPYLVSDTETGKEVVYYFLPTGSMNEQVVFLNAPTGFAFDDKEISSGESISGSEGFLTDTHTLKMRLDSEDSSREAVFMCSSKIGSVFIHTESGSLDYIHESKENKESAQLFASDENAREVFSGDLSYIKCRGKFSFEQYDKKAYKIRFAKEYAFFGMDASESFAFVPSPADISRQRSRLVYEYARNYTDIPAPDSRYVDLYINGEYRGNYLICTDKDDLIKMTGLSDLEKRNDELKEASDQGDITGGYILEQDGNDISFVTDHGHSFEVVYPKNATEVQIEYIKNLMNETEDAIYAEDGINPLTGKPYYEYIDIDSWAEKFVMDELFTELDKTVSGGGRSVFFYKYSDSVDEHLFAGPAWDYDLGTGFGAYVINSNLNHSTGNGSFLGNQLMAKKEMMDAIKEKMCSASIWVDDHMSLALRNDSDMIADSVAMDDVRWKDNFFNSEYSTLELETDYIRFHIRARRDALMDAWLKETIYHTVTFLDYEGNRYREYRVRHGDTLPEIPAIGSYLAVFAGWCDEDGKPLIYWQPVLEDITYHSEWLDAELLALNIEALTETNADGIDVDALQAYVDALKVQQGEDTHD